jgi:predicted MFS family arabinose efflux permease
MGGSFRFDAAGTALFTLFVALLLLMLDRAQRMNAADFGVALGFGVAGGVALWALLRVERVVPDPLLPLPVLTDPVIWRTNLLAACVSGTMVSLISFLPLYLTVVRGVPIATVGAMLLPMSLGGGTGALISGTFLAKTGRNMLLPSIGLVLATATLCVLAFGAGHIPLAWLPWLLALSSLGFGCTFPAVQTTVQVAAGAARLGVATASVQFMRNLGAAAGTAVLGALIFVGFALADPEVAERFAAAMRGGREALASLPEAERAVMGSGLAMGFKAMFVGAAVLTGVAAVLAFRVPLRRV